MDQAIGAPAKARAGSSATIWIDATGVAFQLSSRAVQLLFMRVRERAERRSASPCKSGRERRPCGTDRDRDASRRCSYGSVQGGEGVLVGDLSERPSRRATERSEGAFLAA